VINLVVKHHFAGSPGAPALFNLWYNLKFIFNPRSYLLGEWTYGILLPKGFNVVILFLLFVLVRSGWGGLPRAAKQHALTVLAINAPLFVALGYTDEVRALSMLHVSAALLLCNSVAGWLARTQEVADVPAVVSVRADEVARSDRPVDSVLGRPAVSLNQS
jgi:hypothetical protein